MKKGLLGLWIVAMLGLSIFMIANAMTLHTPRIGGTAGSHTSLVCNPADTIAGTSHEGGYRDTCWSDTVDISDYDYVTVYGKLVSLDTGTSYGGDSIGDTVLIATLTSFGRGSALWTVAIDTMTFTGDSFRHHYKTDTILYNDIFFRSITYDTGTVIVYDTNEYNFDMKILGR
jgi:hypothetical protein